MKNSDLSKTPAAQKSIFTVLGAVALVMAIPFFLQVFFWGPRLKNRLESHGLSIYKSCQWDSIGVIKDWKFPSSEIFPNANVFFVDLVTNDVLRVSWSFFSGGSVRPAEGDYHSGGTPSIQDFTPEHNVWSIVADLNWDDEGAPLYVTGNLVEPALIPAHEAKGPPRIDSTSFREKYVVVIRLGGSTDIIPLKELTWERLNPTNLRNPILPPGDPTVPLLEVSNEGPLIYKEVYFK